MTDKIAFITGADRGLGRSMATHLSSAGIGIVGTYFKNEEQAAKVSREIGDVGGTAVMLQLDLGNSATFQPFMAALAKALRKSFGRDDLDFVVQNAGNGVLGSTDKMTGDELDSLYRVHLKRPFLLNQLLIPLIKRGGRIINVSSAGTRFYLKGHGPYSALKGAVEVVTLYMAKELGDRQITVNIVAPGAIETDFAGGEVRDDKALNRMFAEATPLGRVGLPDDIGAAVTALLSEDMGWLNGQRIEISGGQSL